MILCFRSNYALEKFYSIILIMTYYNSNSRYFNCFIILLFLLFQSGISTLCSQAASQTDSWQEQKSYEGTTLSGTLVKNTFPEHDWWKQFNDDILNGYVSTALINNLTLRAAASRIDEARALVGEAKAARLPSFAIENDFERLRTSDNISTSQTADTGTKVPSNNSINLYNFPLSVNYELDLFGKNKLKVQSAKKTEEEAIQEQRVITLTVTSEILGAYFNFIQTDASIKTTNALINNLNETLKLKQQLYKGGVISYDDILTTEQDLSHNKENLTEYEGQRSVFAHQLCILTGAKPLQENQIKSSTIDQLNFPKDIPVGIPSQLLTHRPDVVEAELALEKANIDVKEARREFFPSINLAGDFGFSAIKLASIL